MTPKGLFQQVRMSPEISDNAGKKYSDYQMMTALNSVLSMVYNALSTFSNSITSKEIVLELTDYVAELPSDFLSTVAVHDSAWNFLQPKSKSQPIDAGSYRIIGSRIYTPHPSVILEYKSWFPEVTYETLEDALGLPDYFGELLRRHVIGLLRGGLSDSEGAVAARIEEDVRRLTANRDHSMMHETPPLESNAGWAARI